MDCGAWKFLHPFTARFVGPTACGKTTFLQSVISRRLIEPWPSRIFYFYGSTWQSPVFDYLQNVHDVVFVKGVDETLLTSNHSKASTLVILDDLILETRDSIIDSKQSTPNHLRLVTNITDSCPLVYVSDADKRQVSIEDAEAFLS